MSPVKLLIIEDEPPQIQVYEDVISQYNKKNDLKIEFTICKSYEEGVKALNTPDYDAAIIDLKLSNTEELEGRKLVESVYQKIRIPIIVYSGSIAQIDDIKENALLKKKLRTEQLSNILNEIIGIYNTGITRFLRPSGTIDNKLTHIFWNHLSNDLELWIKHNNSDTLLRYILSHFQEYLDINPIGDFEDYHPSEVFIKPPVKKNLHTGDLVKFDGGYYILMTPACDMVFNYKRNEKGELIPYRKADTMLVAPAREFDYKTLCLNKKGEVDKGKITEYVKNGNYRFHYLPPCINENGFLIDFQDLRSISFDSKIERIATISSPFIKDIISRFANYYSRQGQPTFQQDAIIESFINKK
jgi:CheY-like chemotaxis protein